MALLQLLHASAHAEDLAVLLPADRAQPAEAFQAPAAVLKALQAVFAAAAGDLSPELMLSSLVAFAELQQRWGNPAAAVNTASIPVLLEGAGAALGSATSRQLLQLTHALGVWWKPGMEASQWLQEWAMAVGSQLASMTTQQQQLLLQCIALMSAKGGGVADELLWVAGELAPAVFSPG